VLEKTLFIAEKNDGNDGGLPIYFKNKIKIQRNNEKKNSTAKDLPTLSLNIIMVFNLLKFGNYLNQK